MVKEIREERNRAGEMVKLIECKTLEQTKKKRDQTHKDRKP